MFFDWLFGDFLKGDVNNVIDGILSPESRKELFGVDSKSVISSYHVTGDSIDITYTVNDEDVDKSKKSEELLEKWESLTSFYDNIKITIKFNNKDIFEYIWNSEQKCFVEKIYNVPDYSAAQSKRFEATPDKGDKANEEKVKSAIKEGLNELDEKVGEKKSVAQILNEKFNFATNLEKKLNVESEQAPIFIPESASDIFEDYIVGGENFEKVNSADRKSVVGIKFSILDLIESSDDKNEIRKKLQKVVCDEDRSLIDFCEILMKMYGFKQVVWDMYTIKRGFAGKFNKSHLDAIDIENGHHDEIDDIEFTACFK